MNLAEFKAQLERYKTSDYFSLDTEDALSQLAASQEPFREQVKVILQFMEENPDTDFGAPGNLVHYMERFMGDCGYEEELMISVKRAPIRHTVWLVNRLANGTDVRWKKEALRMLHALAADESVDADAREAAADFCEFQRKQAGK